LTNCDYVYYHHIHEQKRIQLKQYDNKPRITKERFEKYTYLNFTFDINTRIHIKKQKMKRSSKRREIYNK